MWHAKDASRALEECKLVKALSPEGQAAHAVRPDDWRWPAGGERVPGVGQSKRSDELGVTISQLLGMCSCPTLHYHRSPNQRMFGGQSAQKCFRSMSRSPQCHESAEAVLGSRHLVHDQLDVQLQFF